MRVRILGKSIRANLHHTADATLEPVLTLSNGDSGLGAILHGCATFHYDPNQPDGDCWIETSDPITLYPTAIELPLGDGYFIHTNTIHAQSNRKTIREGRDLPLKEVLVVRCGKRHAPAQLARSIQTQSPVWLIYACSHSTLKPLPCGARVWGFTQSPPILDGAVALTHQPNLF